MRALFGARAAHIWFELNSPAYMFSILVFLLCFKRQCKMAESWIYSNRIIFSKDVTKSWRSSGPIQILKTHPSHNAIKVQFWVCTWCCIGELIHSTALMVSFGAFILSANAIAWWFWNQTWEQHEDEGSEHEIRFWVGHNWKRLVTASLFPFS